MTDLAPRGDATRADGLLGQDVEVALISALAAFVHEPFFVDVGAEKGSFASAMISLGMRGAMFEPMPRHQQVLAEIAHASGSAAYAYAIDERDGVRDLFVATDEQGDELDFFHSLHKLESETRFHHSRAIRVACRSIASLVADGVIPPRVGILKTDTEGNDVSVLKGLGALRPELVVCEYFTEGLYSGWESSRPEVAISLLRSIGYGRYIATKRVGEFEYCAASPAGFLPKQWGNLFFVSDRLYSDAEKEIGNFLGQAEARLIGGMQAICADRIAKEAVIQNLLAATVAPKAGG